MDDHLDDQRLLRSYRDHQLLDDLGIHLVRHLDRRVLHLVRHLDDRQNHRRLDDQRHHLHLDHRGHLGHDLGNHLERRLDDQHLERRLDDLHLDHRADLRLDHLDADLG